MGSSLPPLKAGDTVDIIAPGSQKNPDRLEKAFSFLQSWGLIPRCPDDIFGTDSFYANSTEKRSLFLREALTAPDSQAVWCLRGGYGSTRLLDSLRSMDAPQEKYFIGFSDVTALYLFLHQEWGWRPLHGPTLGQLADSLVDSPSVQALHDLLFQKDFPTLTGMRPLNEPAKKVVTSSFEAPLTGGNASLVQASLGTSWQMETDGRFIFLEDVDEKPYRTLERLEHMRQAGLFEKAKAIFLFDFTFNETGKDIDTQISLYPKAFDQFAQEVPIPVFKGTGVGHSHTNFPLFLGGMMRYENGILRTR